MGTNPMSESQEQAKTICIIGAGAAGLAALRAILDTPQYKAGLWRPIAFEARDNIGGIWLPDAAPPHSVLPQTPLYESLTTNLPHPIMCFPSFPFPPSTPVFPAAAHVQRYLESYASHFNLRPFIRLATLVSDVRWKSSRWTIRLNSGEIVDSDFVIVANGHHKIPRYPNVPGIDAWIAAKKASHSVWYRHPEHLGDRVLVVGGGPSGSDIAAEMRYACSVLIRSITGAPPEDPNEHLKIRGRTTRFGDNGQVSFEDGSVETVDYCILATGYQVSVPFLSVRAGLPPPCPPLPDTLYNSTYHIFPLSRHVFPLQTPTSLAFMGLPVRVAPLPIMEAQAAAILHAFAHPASLDPAQETRAVLMRYAELGPDPAAIARRWSVFQDEEQFIYQDQLYEFAGADNRVPQWRKDMYSAKALLRSFWVDLERRGEADDWVKSVGEGGAEEWVDLLQRLLAAAEE
ncbi:FAD/NAD-P-binding domain-containing protein, partial [Mycena galericulata]